MTIRERILLDLNEIVNPKVLQQLLQFIELLKKNASVIEGNKATVLSFSGVLTDTDAMEIALGTDEAFSNVEGEW
jgi:hypothetical protein